MLLALIAAGAVQTIDPQMVRTREPSTCDRAAARASTLSPVDARKLGHLPPGLLQLAVDKRVAGCSVTVLPTRDARGDHHMMLRDSTARLRPAQGSDAERSRQRQR